MIPLIPAKNLKRVTDLVKFGIDNDLEIVSHGLAPNPDGFCFESHGKASAHVKKYFSDELDRLNLAETKVLKMIIF